MAAVALPEPTMAVSAYTADPDVGLAAAARMARNPFTTAEIDAALDILQDMTLQIERYLKSGGGPWLFGARYTWADIAAAPYVVRFEEERPGRLTPPVAEWWARLTARASWPLAQIGPFGGDNDRSVREAVADSDT